MNGSENGAIMTPGEIAHREKCENLCKTVMESVMVVKRSVPPSDQYEYYGAFPKYQHVIRKLNDSIYKTMNTVFSSEKLSTSFHQDNQSETDFSDKFEMMVEANDVILEKVGNLMDEAMGLRSQPAIKVSSNAPAVVASWNKNQLQSSFKSTKSFSCLNWLPKPQNDFNEKPDNSTLPFTAMLVDKPNSVKALSRSYSLFVKGEYKEAKDQAENQPLLQRSYSFSKQFVEEITEHHYEAELTSFVLPDHFLEPVMCIRPAEATLENLHFIDTLSGLNAMIADLLEEKEIAVDCEAHNHRSFLGFVCLIQISTRKHDYIVDTIALRSHIQKLNAVFTNPEILKVMHGCDSDVLWFQRDFGLYLVNVFDTGQAARALNYPTFALSYLLKRYVNFDAQKEYQMADWRQRPLPNEMLDYARMDTHALLYIADNLRNALYELQNNALFEVFNKSRLLCLKKYAKPEYHANSYQKVLRNVRKRLTNQQEFVISKLYDWREETARTLDESPHYVLPNHMMIRIGEVLPREAQGILACCNPVPPLVREYLSVLHKIIMDAKLKHLANDNETGLKFQSVSKNVSMTEKSFPHDVSQDSGSEAFNDLNAQLDDSLCAEKPQVQLLTKSLYKQENIDKSKIVLSSLEHPLSKYLVDLKIEPKFLTSNERSADSLSLSAKRRGETAKFPHRWRLKAQVVENLLPNNITKNVDQSDPGNDVVQQKPPEIPIVFDTQDSSQSILKDKSAQKKEKKRKKREVIETSSLQDAAPVRKKKRSKTASSSETQSHENLEVDEQEKGFEDVEDEEMEHPTLAPLKKPKKVKRSGLSHSLMPRIKAFSNKSFSFKPK